MVAYRTFLPLKPRQRLGMHESLRRSEIPNVGGRISRNGDSALSISIRFIRALLARYLSLRSSQSPSGQCKSPCQRYRPRLRPLRPPRTENQVVFCTYDPLTTLMTSKGPRQDSHSPRISLLHPFMKSKLVLPGPCCRLSAH